MTPAEIKTALADSPSDLDASALGYIKFLEAALRVSVDTDIGFRLKVRGLNQSEFAKQVGMHRSNLSSVMTRRRRAPQGERERIAKALNCDADDLFGYDGIALRVGDKTKLTNGF